MTDAFLREFLAMLGVVPPVVRYLAVVVIVVVGTVRVVVKQAPKVVDACTRHRLVSERGRATSQGIAALRDLDADSGSIVDAVRAINQPSPLDAPGVGFVQLETGEPHKKRALPAPRSAPRVEQARPSRADRGSS